ncbi:MAG: hypothetical protein ABH956_00600 [Candidatus Nealsonbacteria bacterium]
MKCGFNLEHYKETIKLAKNKGYVFLKFGQKEKTQKIIYLRHDIDFENIKDILNMAEIENSFGVKSTYLIMLSNPLYNLDFKNCFYLKKILSLGHEIGLHFDNLIYPNFSLIRIKKMINCEAKIIESILDQEIKIVSFHNPVKNFINNFKLKKFISVYSDKYFKDIKYISDSNRNWREGSCFCKIIKEKKYNKIQILIHPGYWLNSTKKEIIEKVKSNLKNDNKKAQRFLKRANFFKDIKI